MYNRLSYVIILILLVILLITRTCNKKTDDIIESVTTTDTIWKITHDTVFKTVGIIKKEYVYVDSISYTPGSTLDTCKYRFDNLLKQHLTQTMYADTLSLDSLGTVIIKDTVWMNKLYGKRTYVKNYKIPYVEKTTILTSKPKRQLYIGGNLFGDKNSFQAIAPGLLYKDRKDRVFQANIGIDSNGNINYGLGSYWKIKF